MFGALPLSFRRSWMACLALTILASIAGGCKKPAEITRYQVPKEKPPTPPPTSSDLGSANGKPKTPGQDRMLAAIIPHRNDAWFFKLAGNGEAVGQHAEAFESLVKSVAFPESAGGKPEWKSPEDWQRQPGKGFRFATLLIPSNGGGKPLELSVTTLPWDATQEKAAVLSNVNRWRAQMQLSPLEPDELARETRQVKLAEHEVIFVDFKGTYTEGMRSQVANPSGGTEN